ncbi:MAG TPA: tetratricopeptide repeat protein, partial [Sulfurivirga caldicuralii]|nr:tetratricopeptide repeat protein [Sulfurivirga caldicuralii]
MSRYETDEEQWEAIKQWWKENGKLIVLAAIVGVGAVTGWNMWQQNQYQKAVLASSTFELLQLKYQQG